MKRKIAALCAMTTILLTACSGSGEKVIEKEAVTTTKEAVTESKDTAQGTTESQKQEIQAKGYVFEWNSTAIEIDAEAKPIIEALGEPISYFEAASCAFDGLDKIYTYNSFEIDTYPVQDADYISAIIFKDDSITTAEGIAIGETRARVEEVYGTDYEEQGTMLVYRKDDMKLSFILQEDAVISIQYNSTVLDE